MPGEEKPVVLPKAIPANYNQNINHPVVPFNRKVKFIEILHSLQENKRSKTLEDLGYKLNSSLNKNNNHFIYVNDKCKTVIAVILGFEKEYNNLILDILNPLNILKVEENKNKFIKIINYLVDNLEQGKSFIKDIKKTYVDYKVTFLGYSIGGFIINTNLQDTIFKCYTYNPAFINENKNKSNGNIINYRTSGDIISLGYLFEEYTKTIEVRFFDYLLKNNLQASSVINYIINSHYLNFLDNYEDKQIEIEIPSDNTNKFLWGASTAAFQVEGSVTADGRGKTIWDTFIEQADIVYKDQNADIACNSYVQYRDDIEALKLMGSNSYRFSIAWSRILPSGSGKINQPGIQHYNDVINACLENGITPIVTLYHWDLPQGLQDKYGGWLCANGEIWEDFKNYADICFAAFGDRVKHWATINEPQTIAVDCYEYNWYAPGAGTADGNSVYGYEYKAAHNLLIAHAYAVDLYRKKYAHQNGQIGLVCNMDWAEPYTNDPQNVDAAERRNVFWGGWFWDPIFFGDYPKLMKDLVGTRLPTFTCEQSALLKGSIDIFFLNTYSSVYVYNQDYTCNNFVGWDYDQQTACSYYSQEGKIIGKETQSSWLHIVPWGVNKLLTWIQNRYSYDGQGTGIGIENSIGELRKLSLIITENGLDILNQSDTSTYEECKPDADRIYYYSSYLSNIADSVKKNGIDFAGYLPWSLLDNFEWTNGYKCRFGIFYLDCNSSDDIPRLPKDSVSWFKQYTKKYPDGPVNTFSIDARTKNLYTPKKAESFKWAGGEIRGYYYWSEDFYSNPDYTPNNPDGTNLLYTLDTITDIQTNIDPPDQLVNFTQKSYEKRYPEDGKIMSETNFNAVFLFTQYTDYTEMVNNNDLNTIYNNAIDYFKTKNNKNYLLGLCFGSGTFDIGEFTLGKEGSIASIYAAITPLNEAYTYTESTGTIIEVTGTGSVNYAITPSVFGEYNCLIFDIELGDPDILKASDIDNLMLYVKTLYPQMIIIIDIAHSCSYKIPEVTTKILESSNFDYVSPIIYTYMFGTTNEYCPNNNLSWEGFFDILEKNNTFKTYGLNCILPSIFNGFPSSVDGVKILDSYRNGGSNTGNPPNLYYYQSTDTSITPVIEENCKLYDYLGYYKKDTGAIDFFNETNKYYSVQSDIPVSKSLGGFIQWNNYTNT
jgi:beta-glucosidase